MTSTTMHVPGVRFRSEEGFFVTIPETELEHAAEKGVEVLTVRIVKAKIEPWLTLTEASAAHMQDVDGMTLGNAKVKISRAIAVGKIESVGARRQLRIEPKSLAAWRLAEREKNLRD